MGSKRWVQSRASERVATRARPSPAWTLLGTAAVVAIAGVVVLGFTIAGRSDAGAAPGAEIDGLSLELTSTERVAGHHQQGQDHDQRRQDRDQQRNDQDQQGHDHDSGFQMPAAMMPGAPPRGLERVHVEVSIANEATTPRRLGAGEFGIATGDGDVMSPTSTEYAGRALFPGQVMWLDLYFDVAEAESALDLVWRRGIESVRLPLGGTPLPDHDH